MTQSMLNANFSPNRVEPIGTMNSDLSTSLIGMSSASDVYSYLCPDYLAGFDFDNSIGKIDDKMEEAGWLTPYSYVGGAIIRGKVITRQCTQSCLITQEQMLIHQDNLL